MTAGSRPAGGRGRAARRPLILAAAAALVSGLAPAPAPGFAPYAGTPVSGYAFAWGDEFDGDSFDTNRWEYRTGARYWSYQLPGNVAVSNGLLILLLKKESAGGLDYTAGGAISRPVFRYGYYEARMRVPPGRGWHTSFWTARSHITNAAEPRLELDVIENDSVSPTKYSVNTHQWNPPPHQTFGHQTVNTPDLSAGFHVFGCEFTPATVRYFFDGALVQTVDATQFPHGDANIWLTSIASPLGGTTNVDDSLLPLVAEFDYARFFLQPSTVTVRVVRPDPVGVTLAGTSAALRVAAAVTCSDTGLAPAIAWSRVSGPGPAVFADPAAADTTVRFAATGLYWLACAATAGLGGATAQVAVAVRAGDESAAPPPATLREGENGYAHGGTFLRADTTSWNSGAREQVLAGRYNGGLRVLFSFDLSGVPAADPVTGAALELWTHTSAGVGTVGPLELHALAATPVEGTGDGLHATNGAGSGATWVSRTGSSAASNRWTTPGGDYAAAVLSDAPAYDATATNRPVVFPSTPDLALAVQAAVAAGRPLDLLILAPENEVLSTNRYSRLCSDDAPVAACRPRLTLQFDRRQAPALACGGAPVATQGVAAALQGAASNADGCAWSLVGGPGVAAFGDPAVPTTTVVFSDPGVHVLRFAASNAWAGVSDELAVTVAANPAITGCQSVIAIPGYTRAGTLTGFPALVRLGRDLPGFSYGGFAPGGADLRFEDGAGAALPHEIERWDPGGSSWIWVGIPRLSNGCSIVARWGGGAPTGPPAFAPSAVWSNGYVAVWHLADTGLLDSARTHHAVSNTAAAADGLTGAGAWFNGTTAMAQASHQPDLVLPGPFEVQGWFRTAPGDRPPSGDYYVLTAKQAYFTNRTWWLALRSEGWLWWKDSGGVDLTNQADLCDGAWHHVAAVRDGAAARLYVDGVERAARATTGPADTPAEDVSLGSESGSTRHFAGWLDEMRVSSVARSPDWIAAAYASMAANAAFVQVGPVSNLVRAGGFEGYAAQIADPGQRGPADDPDGDGYANLLEYVAGGNPAAADDRARLTAVWTNNAFHAAFGRNPAATDATILVEAAGPLAPVPEWSAIATNALGSWGAAPNVAESGTGSPVRVRVRDADGSVRALRLRVTRP